MFHGAKVSNGIHILCINILFELIFEPDQESQDSEVSREALNQTDVV